MSDEQDIIIVGAGPAGLSAAREAASGGLSVLILESKRDVGIPIQCGESISSNTLSISGLPGEGPWIMNKFKGYRIRSPSGDELYSTADGYCIKRDLFDKELLRRAEEKGARIHTGEPLRSAEHVGGRWVMHTNKGTYSSCGVVLACGSNPLVPSMFGMEPFISSMKALGIKVRREMVDDSLTFFVKEELGGGYGWSFPRGSEVNIGICAGKDIAHHIAWLRRVLSIRDDEIISYHGGVIPSSGLCGCLFKDGVVMAGDAGGFSNPVTKGGIVGALVSGTSAGKALSSYLSGDGEALSLWERGMRSHPAFSPMNVRRIQFLASLNEVMLDTITGLVKGRDVMSIPRTELVKLVLGSPDLVKELKGAIGLVRGLKEWTKWSF